jgi:hypothetical protein
VKVEDSRRREILNQIDEITKQIWETQPETNRQQIDQLYEELYQRIKQLRADDAGETAPK